ncbi:MAG: 30S ribosomal protein S12 methylthiotransferase RimO [candidate division WOR-3 bacterium]
MKVNLISLGCPKNLVDSENILGGLGASGVTVCARPQDSDVIIINTCGFIAPAIEETEQTIEEMIAYARNGRRIYVVGCAVNRCEDDLKRRFPQVSGWFRLEQEKEMISTVTQQAAVIESRLPTTNGYAFLKISEGCSNQCAYCTIPMIKGAFRSFDYNKVIQEAYELAKLGIRELIVIGQDTTRYGYDLYGRPMLKPLLHDLSQIPGIEWLRIMYAHPRSIDDGILDEIARNPKVCKYIDMPIQHINDRILGLMERNTSRDRITKTLARLKKIQNMAIRTTVIVGYPTESDAEFNELMEFVKAGHIDWLGVFPYYREAGTKAAQLAGLTDDVIEERYSIATKTQQQLVAQRNEQRKGNVYKVLIHDRADQFVGHAEFSAPEIDSQVLIENDNLEVGRYYRVRINTLSESDLLGELANESNGVI